MSRPADQVARIWAAHHEPTRNFLIRRAGDPDPQAIDDALGTAAERLTQAITDGLQLRSPGAWLRTVAWNEYVTIAHRRGGRALWRHDALEAGAEAGSDEIPQQLAREEAAEQLDHALDRAVGLLTPHQRAMVLGFYDGLSYQELAAKHGLSWTSVSKALARARAKLAADQELAEAVAEFTDE